MSAREVERKSGARIIPIRPGIIPRPNSVIYPPELADGERPGDPVRRRERPDGGRRGDPPRIPELPADKRRERTS